jgi:hypothetical protein
MKTICIIAASAASIALSAFPAVGQIAPFAFAPGYGAYAAPCPYAYGFPSAYGGYNVIGYERTRQHRTYRRRLR